MAQKNLPLDQLYPTERKRCELTFIKDKAIITHHFYCNFCSVDGNFFDFLNWNSLETYAHQQFLSLSISFWYNKNTYKIFSDS